MKRQYKKVSDSKREQLIECIRQRDITIKEAAEACGINYENAKAIARVFRKEKRVIKRNRPVPGKRSEPSILNQLA